MGDERIKVTVENLVVALDRVEQWIRAVRAGLESLPRDQVIEIEESELPEARQPDVFVC